MQQENRIFFALLQAALGLGGAEAEMAAADTVALAPEMCAALLNRGERHDVAHLVALGLRQLAPDTAGDEAERYIFQAVFRHEQHKYTLDSLCEIFDGANIPFILLKGAVLRGFYPEAWMRTSCDIDLLIRPRDADAAIAALLAAGYSRLEDNSTHDYSLRSPGGVHLELHYTLAQDGVLPEADKVLAGVWENAYTTGGSSCEMSGEMFVLYHIAHMAKHILHGGCGVRPFVDLWLLEQKMAFDRDALAEKLGRAALADFYKAAVALSRVWLESQPHTQTTRALEEYVLTGGVYGTAANAAKAEAAEGVGKLRSFCRLMFLPRESLELIYPSLKNRPALMPLYQVRRWLRVFERDRRQKILRITRARSSVTPAEEQKTVELLETLGLIRK